MPGSTWRPCCERWFSAHVDRARGVKVTRWVPHDGTNGNLRSRRLPLHLAESVSGPAPRALQAASGHAYPPIRMPARVPPAALIQPGVFRHRRAAIPRPWGFGVAAGRSRRTPLRSYLTANAGPDVPALSRAPVVSLPRERGRGSLSGDYGRVVSSGGGRRRCPVLFGAAGPVAGGGHKSGDQRRGVRRKRGEDSATFAGSCGEQQSFLCDTRRVRE